MKNILAASAAALVLSAGLATAAPRAGDTPFAFPVNVTSLDQGSFVGTFKIERFAVHEGALVASGSLVGTLLDETGTSRAIYRTATIPVILPPSATRGAAAVEGLGCDILHLELGPLHLDLLGLVIDLNRIVLDIDAEPGAGNLLGNLLCAIVGLLDGSNLGLLSQLLNQLLGLLG